MEREIKFSLVYRDMYQSSGKFQPFAEQLERIAPAIVLKDKVPLCIFPEGTHQAKYSMLPLSKGIFRIALQAKELLGDTPLYIVPMGIRYGNFYRFRSSVRVQAGNPINVGEFIAQNSEKTPQEQINLMKKLLEERMKETILYIPNDDEYKAKNEICAAVSKLQLKEHERDITEPLVAVNREAAKRIETLKEEKPEVAGRLLTLGKEAERMRRLNHISLRSVAKWPSATNHFAEPRFMLSVSRLNKCSFIIIFCLCFSSSSCH